MIESSREMANANKNPKTFTLTLSARHRQTEWPCCQQWCVARCSLSPSSPPKKPAIDGPRIPPCSPPPPPPVPCISLFYYCLTGILSEDWMNLRWVKLGWEETTWKTVIRKSSLIHNDQQMYRFVTGRRWWYLLDSPVACLACSPAWSLTRTIYTQRGAIHWPRPPPSTGISIFVDFVAYRKLILLWIFSSDGRQCVKECRHRSLMKTRFHDPQRFISLSLHLRKRCVPESQYELSGHLIMSLTLSNHSCNWLSVCQLRKSG